MTRSRLPVILVLAALASAAAASCGRPDEAARIARVENGLRSPVVIKGDPAGNILERMKHYKVPGVSIAVFDGRRVLWAKGYGVMDADTKEPVTEQTLFVAGSISKPVAAMAALKLVDEGKIGLDRNINDVLTSWKLPENDLTAGHPVTLRELLSHSGGTTVHGFGGYAEGQAVPSITDVLDGKGNSPAVLVDLEPGKQWRYSGGGVTVMQLALMDIEKSSFPEILRTKVLEPIGMTASSYEQTFTPERLKLAASGHKADGKVIPGKRHTYPEMAAAGLWTTPTDLAKFAMEVRLEARGQSRQVLSKETAGLMLKPQIAIAPGQDMALGMFLEDHGGEVYYGHGGQDEGFIAQLLADRESGYGAAVMTNSDGDADPLIGEILQAIAAEYGWKNYVATPLDRANLSPGALQGFAGRYRLDSDTVLGRVAEGGRALRQAERRRRVRTRARRSGRIRPPRGPAPLCLRRRRGRRSGRAHDRHAPPEAPGPAHGRRRVRPYRVPPGRPSGRSRGRLPRPSGTRTRRTRLSRRAGSTRSATTSCAPARPRRRSSSSRSTPRITPRPGTSTTVSARVTPRSAGRPRRSRATSGRSRSIPRAPAAGPPWRS